MNKDFFKNKYNIICFIVWLLLSIWILWFFLVWNNNHSNQTPPWGFNWQPPSWWGWPYAWQWWQSSSSVELKSWTWGLELSSWEQSISDKVYSTSWVDSSTIVVNSWASLTIDSWSILKVGWDVSNTESSEFYWLNAWVVATNSSTLTIKNSNILTNAWWANWVFSTNNAVVNLENVKITTQNTSGSRWLDATYGWTINWKNIEVSTVWIHSAWLATDRWEWNINIDTAKVITTWQDSPIIYSTWKFEVKNLTWNAIWSEACVIEWQNSISLTDSVISWAKKWWVMIYQSFSGDAEWTGWTFTMKNWSLSASVWPIFYITNTTAYINLENVLLSWNDWKLLTAEANSRWWTTWSNWWSAVLNATNQVLSWDIEVDNISSLKLNLKSNSNLTWWINNTNKAKSIDLTLDETSKVNLTKNSYVTTITANISNDEVKNIYWNGFNLYYSSKDNSNLSWKTYKLQNGGELIPY